MKKYGLVFSRTLASAGKELKDNFLKALAEREENNRNGILTVSKIYSSSLLLLLLLIILLLILLLLL